MMHVYGKYFCGNEISTYGLEHNRVDYATLAKAFDAVINNDIMTKTYDIGYWEMVSGFTNNSQEIEEIEERIEELENKKAKLEELVYESFDDIEDKLEELTQEISILEDKKQELEEEEEYIPDVCQWYIVSDNGAKLLEEINEILYYNEELDMYLWGVTHFGTSWSYVLTDIPCNTGFEEV